MPGLWPLEDEWFALTFSKPFSIWSPGGRMNIDVLVKRSESGYYLVLGESALCM